MALYVVEYGFPLSPSPWPNSFTVRDMIWARSPTGSPPTPNVAAISGALIRRAKCWALRVDRPPNFNAPPPKKKLFNCVLEYAARKHFQSCILSYDTQNNRGFVFRHQNISSFAYIFGTVVIRSKLSVNIATWRCMLRLILYGYVLSPSYFDSL